MEALEFNLQTMQKAFQNSRANLRAHVKNHKCVDLAHMQIQHGSKGVTCATVREAEAMLQGGITDILIANEVVGKPNVELLVRLSTMGADVKCALDSRSNASEISTIATSANTSVGILIDMQVGMQRCGVEPMGPSVELAKYVQDLPGLHLLGLMAYEGHVGSIIDPGERRRICLDAINAAVETRKLMSLSGLNAPVISTSSSKSYDIASSHPEVTEVQAGMYLFGDPVLEKLGLPFKQAQLVQATVISRPSDNWAVANAGIKSVTGVKGMPTIMGRTDCEVEALNAEHTRIRILNPKASLNPGDLLLLAPAYGDLVTSLSHDRIYAIRDDQVEHIWCISA
tara:strand:- start:9354 stop:10376 length:1023 start_codon:yes stop_codon:yes gene_type:complete